MPAPEFGITPQEAEVFRFLLYRHMGENGEPAGYMLDPDGGVMDLVEDAEDGIDFDSICERMFGFYMEFYMTGGVTSYLRGEV